MRINFVQSANFCSYSNDKPSFTSIHPVRFCIKAQDGNFYYENNELVVKKMQGKLVKWLNAYRNELLNMANGRVTKSKTKSADDSLRKLLIKFFVENDRDYKADMVVRSAYVASETGDSVTPYIITGKHVKRFDEASKSIENVHRGIKDRRDIVADYYGIDKRSEIPLLESEKRSINEAKQGYHGLVEKAVKELLNSSDVDKSTLTFYFEPVYSTSKNKPVTFKLVNALIQKFML